MRVFAFPRPLYHLPRDFSLSPAAKRRLAWFDFYHTHDHNARLTCRHFALSPRTFYKWKARFNPRDLSSLEDRSRRPKRLRSSPLPQATVEKVIALRKEFPAWSKYKLAGRALIRRRGRPLRNPKPIRRKSTPGK
jgi:transposase